MTSTPATPSTPNLRRKLVHGSVSSGQARSGSARSGARCPADRLSRAMRRLPNLDPHTGRRARRELPEPSSSQNTSLRNLLPLNEPIPQPLPSGALSLDRSPSSAARAAIFEMSTPDENHGLNLRVREQSTVDLDLSLAGSPMGGPISMESAVLSWFGGLETIFRIPKADGFIVGWWMMKALGKEARALAFERAALLVMVELGRPEEALYLAAYRGRHEDIQKSAALSFMEFAMRETPGGRAGLRVARSMLVRRAHDYLPGKARELCMLYFGLFHKYGAELLSLKPQAAGGAELGVSSKMPAEALLDGATSQAELLSLYNCLLGRGSYVIAQTAADRMGDHELGCELAAIAGNINSATVDFLVQPYLDTLPHSWR